MPVCPKGVLGQQDRFYGYLPLNSDSMEIHFEETPTKGTFFIQEGGPRLAEMIFSKAGSNIIIIEHTEVSETLKGTGAGKKLVAAGVEYARKNHLKIVPVCPFAKAVFEKTPEYADVWHKP